MGALTFIGGGVRSGKSSLALRIAEEKGTRRVFIATAQAWDDEMRDRIRRHKDERDATWRTVEEPLAVPAALQAITGCDVVLIDCLTLWLTNLLLAEEDDIQAHIQALIAAVEAAPFDVVVVTNEVGLGIVPANALSRRFRDEAGWAHQSLAAAAGSVYFGAMGMMLRLKPGPVEPVL